MTRIEKRAVELIGLTIVYHGLSSKIVGGGCKRRGGSTARFHEHRCATLRP